MTAKDLTPDAILAQERELVFDAFGPEVAWALGGSIVEIARQRALPVTIDISVGEQQLFHCALPGTAADNDEWIKRKNRVVRRFGHSSFYLGVTHGEAFAERFGLDEREFAAHGGAFPITLRGGGVIGTVAVSGLPQEDDHRLVVEALRAFLARMD